MINIEIPSPNIVITKQKALNTINKTPISSKYGFSDYINIPRRINGEQVAGIYMFFNEAEELLYCGQTDSLRSRVREHFYSDSSAIKNYRDEVYQIKIIYVKDDFEREIYETFIINKLESKYNIAKNFKRLRNAAEIDSNKA
ncbi:GIY-YIG nuclease family protein [Metabacillus litoralis]|uniref:GIY-YIG nuclease family protein n=1 Tax=Metabacillus litoralis TaxID=152268 RepID=UPI001B9C052C|nr:GIY-YIG nuclease family protein [Metabacillus litoralis]UHA60661.1 GIY-YIG nuclease family protein [Metabacillus litoralis]